MKYAEALGNRRFGVRTVPTSPHWASYFLSTCDAGHDVRCYRCRCRRSCSVRRYTTLFRTVKSVHHRLEILSVRTKTVWPWMFSLRRWDELAASFYAKVYTNVGVSCFTPPKLYAFQTNPKSVGPLKAVLVFIHGGAFQTGTSSMFAQDLLVPRDILLVTMNYRLGPFGKINFSVILIGSTCLAASEHTNCKNATGFLNLNISECPGNMGLWDQSMALKWIRQNIASFGGDPNRITLSGQSAGATSTYLHILSPASQGVYVKCAGRTRLEIG